MLLARRLSENGHTRGDPVKPIFPAARDLFAAVSRETTGPEPREVESRGSLTELPQPFKGGCADIPGRAEQYPRFAFDVFN